MQIFTLIISIISLSLSLYNFIYDIYRRICKITIIVNKHLEHNNTHQFFVTIQNCSQLPISISNISINNSYFCELEPVLVCEKTRTLGHTIISRTEIKTITFPINLNSLESMSGYLEFRQIENFNIDNISFNIFTNRKYIKNSLPIMMMKPHSNNS